MKTKSVSYSKSIEKVNSMGLKSWEKFGVEVDLEPGNTETEAIIHAKAVVEAAHQMGRDEEGKEYSLIREIMQFAPKEAEENRISVIINDLQQCQVIDERSPWGAQIGLIAFQDVAKSHPDIQAAYDAMITKLKNQ